MSTRVKIVAVPSNEDQEVPYLGTHHQNRLLLDSVVCSLLRSRGLWAGNYIGAVHTRVPAARASIIYLASYMASSCSQLPPWQ